MGNNEQDSFEDLEPLKIKIDNAVFSSDYCNIYFKCLLIIAFCKNVFNKCLENCANKTVLVEIVVNIFEKYFNSAIESRMKIIFFGLV